MLLESKVSRLWGLRLQRLETLTPWSYLPPPAQAQAQPAQAQAQAQPRLPPPPILRPLVVGFGGGLVTLVTRLVNSLTLPITFWEKV